MKKLILATLLTMIAGCDRSSDDAGAGGPYASTYRPLPATNLLLRNATILTGTGTELTNADLLLMDGRVRALGARISPPDGVVTIDATDKWVTPGIIDVHSHLGVYPSPSVYAHQDGNEATAPVTAAVWAEHSVWPQDPGFGAALAGGVTTLQILPGSANLIGGRTVTLKNVPARTVQQMKFPGAPQGLKMACGENPKRTYGQAKSVAPATRMGNVAGYRTAWIRAAAYRDERRNLPEAERPERDLELETLAAVLDGELRVHNHCYRADEMAVMFSIAKEFGYRIAAFHHAAEAYKVPELLAENDTCAAMWADWWGFKMEAFDGIRENVAIVEQSKACAIIHSDSEIGIQRLNQEAAKAMAAGRRAGIDIERGTAITWITRNPARALGIATETGTLEAGKAADVVVWSGDPFSVYSRAERVFIDGALVYDREDPARQPVSDFKLGTHAENGGLR